MRYKSGNTPSCGPILVAVKAGGSLSGAVQKQAISEQQSQIDALLSRISALERKVK